MQTEFAEKVGRRFSLERGIEGSQAKHQAIKQYYAKIQAPTPEIKTKIPEVTTSQKIAEAVGIATDHSRALEQQRAARQKRLAEFRALREAEQAKAKQYEVEKAANKAREARLSELRENGYRSPQFALGERPGASGMQLLTARTGRTGGRQRDALRSMGRSSMPTTRPKVVVGQLTW